MDGTFFILQFSIFSFAEILLDIHKIISEVLDKSDIKMVEEIEDIFEADMQSREMTKELIRIN